MAKRKHRLYHTLDSTEIQGEGSYVKIRNLALKDIMAHISPNGKIAESEAAEMGLRVLDEMIVDWNWVDDDDTPLPIPAQNPGTIASLPFQEANWLLTATGLGEMFNQKN